MACQRTPATTPDRDVAVTVAPARRTAPAQSSPLLACGGIAPAGADCAGPGLPQAATSARTKPTRHTTARVRKRVGYPPAAAIAPPTVPASGPATPRPRVDTRVRAEARRYGGTRSAMSRLCP